MSVQKSDEAMRGALKQVVQGQSLDAQTCAAVVREMMSGACEPAQIGAFLMGMAVKGETIDEIVGAAQAMREAAVTVPCQRSPLIDTCGTGGSGIPRRNVSTAVAIAAAACGVAVAKHGNRAASSRSGSADVLEALGVNIAASAAQVARCVDEVGVGFLFARSLHPAMKYAAPVRKAMGVRTMFNFLGPLTNPAGARRQVMGVFDPVRARPLAEALGALGSERVFVVHGFRTGVPAGPDSPPGIDDLSPEGESLVVEWFRGEIVEHRLSPRAAGIEVVPLAELAGGDPKENAEALRRLLDGEAGAYRNAVAFAGAMALSVASDEPLGETVAANARRIEAVLAGGQAKAVLEALIRTSQEEGS